MKNIILVILVFLLMSGCSGGEKNEATTGESPTENVQENNVSQSNADKYSDWHTQYKSIGENYGVLFYDVPSWTPGESGTSKTFTSSGDCVLLFTGSLRKRGDNDLFESATKEALLGVNYIITADHMEASMRENKKINDLDTIHFVGTIHDTDYDYDCYVTGYVFEYDEAACGVFGIVYDKEQPQDLIDLVTEYADHMITTVRESQ